MKILIVLTSHSKLGDTGNKTGFWLEEFAAPYYVFLDAGAEVTLVSPLGGQPPLDPKSDEPTAQTASTLRFKRDSLAQNQLAHTLPLQNVTVADFDGLFYPGGHGPLWDLATSGASARLIEETAKAGKPMAFVCHAPGVLKNVRNGNGDALVSGKVVTGFSNSEEAAVGLTDVVPFLVEDTLTASGGNYSKAADWQPHVVADGSLITGQNPASSEPAAKLLIEQLQSR